jgi:peroxiredoxin
MTPLAGRVARWGQKVALGLALVMALPLSLAAAQSASDERPEPGHLAPDFDLADLSGERVRLSDLRGKKAVFLNFWASWCPSCQHEMPTMEALYRQFKGQGLEILAVSIDRRKADVAKFMNTHRMTFPVLLDPDSMVAHEYRVTAIPTHYFIDRTGVIRSREVAARDWSKPGAWTAIEELLRRGAKK